MEIPNFTTHMHGKPRNTQQSSGWPQTGQTSMPADASAIQSVTPSDIFAWRGPNVHLTGQSGRTGIENNWFALRARVVAVKAETDGDLHIELQNAIGDKPGIVDVEVPAKPQWCEIRQTVFSWTHPKFPFRVRSGRKLKITEPRIITVTGKGFFDSNHAPADQSNRRTDLQDKNVAPNDRASVGLPCSWT